MAIEWPASLPLPTQSGYGYSPKSAVAESNMDDGTVLVRRRYIRTPYSVRVNWRMTKAQLATFESFFQYTLTSGVLYFNTPLINGKGVNRVSAQFDQSSGTPYSVAQADSLYDSFDVSATLRTFALPVDTA